MSPSRQASSAEGRPLSYCSISKQRRIHEGRGNFVPQSGPEVRRSSRERFRIRHGQLHQYLLFFGFRRKRTAVVIQQNRLETHNRDFFQNGAPAWLRQTKRSFMPRLVRRNLSRGQKFDIVVTKHTEFTGFALEITAVKKSEVFCSADSVVEIHTECAAVRNNVIPDR